MGKRLIIKGADFSKNCILKVAEPLIDYVTGSITGYSSNAVDNNTHLVTITAQEGCSIFYTTNGDTPSTNSAKYSVPITVNGNEVIKAVSINSDGDSSGISSLNLADIPVRIKHSIHNAQSVDIMAPATIKKNELYDFTFKTSKEIKVTSFYLHSATDSTFSDNVSIYPNRITPSSITEIASGGLLNGVQFVFGSERNISYIKSSTVINSEYSNVLNEGVDILFEVKKSNLQKVLKHNKAISDISTRNKAIDFSFSANKTYFVLVKVTEGTPSNMVVRDKDSVSEAIFSNLKGDISFIYKPTENKDNMYIASFGSTIGVQVEVYELMK